MTRNPTASRSQTPIHARAIAVLAAVALFGVAPSARGDVKPVKKGTAVMIEGHLDLKGAPAKVWKTLTSMEGFCALTGYKVAGPLRARSLAKLGDSMPAQVGIDTGRFVVTAFLPGGELRVAWEPANGAYICTQRIVLAPTASGGTSLDYKERYTDDQPGVDETAAKVHDEAAKAIEAFRALAEK